MSEALSIVGLQIIGLIIGWCLSAWLITGVWWPCFKCAPEKVRQHFFKGNRHE